MDEKTTGLISLKPGRGFSAGRSSPVIVSPILTSETVLTPAMMYPTSPADRVSFFTRVRAKRPTSSTL